MYCRPRCSIGYTIAQTICMRARSHKMLTKYNFCAVRAIAPSFVEVVSFRFRQEKRLCVTMRTSFQLNVILRTHFAGPRTLHTRHHFLTWQSAQRSVFAMHSLVNRAVAVRCMQACISHTASRWNYNLPFSINTNESGHGCWRTPSAKEYVYAPGLHPVVWGCSQRFRNRKAYSPRHGPK